MKSLNLQQINGVVIVYVDIEINVGIFDFELFFTEWYFIGTQRLISLIH